MPRLWYIVLPQTLKPPDNSLNALSCTEFLSVMNVDFSTVLLITTLQKCERQNPTLSTFSTPLCCFSPQEHYLLLLNQMTMMSFCHSLTCQRMIKMKTRCQKGGNKLSMVMFCCHLRALSHCLWMPLSLTEGLAKVQNLLFMLFSYLSLIAFLFQLTDTWKPGTFVLSIFKLIAYNPSVKDSQGCWRRENSFIHS